MLSCLGPPVNNSNTIPTELVGNGHTYSRESFLIAETSKATNTLKLKTGGSYIGEKNKGAIGKKNLKN